jgi:hypothetical protein
VSRTDKLGITCRNCNTRGEVPSKAYAYQCPACKLNYEATRCGKCHRAYLTDEPAWSSSQCPECGSVEKRRNAAESTFGDLEESLTAPPPRSPAPSKRARTGSPSALQMNSTNATPLDRLIGRFRLRSVPLIVSFVYVALGLLYFFRWGSLVEHVPSLWLGPGDLRLTYFASSQVAHGQFGAIYNRNLDFVEFPGMLILLAPLGALGNVFHTTLLEVTKTQSVPVPFSLHYAIPFLNPQQFNVGGQVYVSHPQWVVAVDPYVLLLSCITLFACDALARRFQVSRQRRAVITFVEAVLLWSVTVLYGHPEDAVAIALAVYALIFALDKRFVGAGWLFGAAVAFQPLVLLMVPVLLAMAGRRSGIALGVRSVLPTAVLLSFPLIANFNVTFRELVDQPSFPNLNHATPWTALASRLGGQGLGLTVAAGPVRVLAIPFAIGIGIWVARRRWLGSPELLAFACAVGFALRTYTESVLVAYYLVGALAIGLVVAGRSSRWRFGVASLLAITITILGQLKLAWFPWWMIQVGGLTGFLIVIAKANSAALGAGTVGRTDVRTSSALRTKPASGAAKSNATRGARSSSTKGQPGPNAGKNRSNTAPTTKRSGRR